MVYLPHIINAVVVDGKLPQIMQDLLGRTWWSPIKGHDDHRTKIDLQLLISSC